MIDGFSRRSVILFVIAMIAATALTIAGTYYLIARFVFNDTNAPHEGRRLVTGTEKRCEGQIVPSAGWSRSG
jgi:hypothetical protein